MTDVLISNETFVKREDNTIPSLQSDFANDSGMCIAIRMDKSLEFLAVDFLGLENIRKVADDIIVSF